MFENLSPILSGVKQVAAYSCPPNTVAVDIISGPWRYLVAMSFLLAVGLAWDVQRLLKKNGMEGGFVSGAVKALLASFHEKEKENDAQEKKPAGEPKGPL